MHPLGMYLAINDNQREHGLAADDDRRTAFARVDARPTARPVRSSRIARLVSIVRRQIVRTAGA